MPSPPNNWHPDDAQAFNAVGLDSELDMLSDAYRLGFAPAAHEIHAVGRSILIKNRIKGFVADSVYVAFVTAGWLAINVLGALGCAVAFFIVISAGDWDAFFLQLDNLTSRYVSADLGRRGAFEHQIAIAFLLILAVISLLRLPSFLRNLRGGLIQGRVR